MRTVEHIAGRADTINRGRLIAIGSVDEMRAKAGMQGSALEEVFIKPTEEKAAVD